LSQRSRFSELQRSHSIPSNGRKKPAPGEDVMAEKVVPVSRLLDERGLGSFQIKLIIWSFFLVIFDL
jgi:hypothetical protein